jgi:hypothetical protein
MSYNFIPRNDRKFLAWIIYLLNYIMNLGLDLLHIPTADYADVDTKVKDFEDKLVVAEDPNKRTKGAVQAKNDARKVAEKAARGLISEYLTYSKVLTNADRDNMGLPIHDTTHTPAPIPDDMPTVEINTSKHQKHKLHVKTGTLTGRSKPPKVHGVEVWRKMGGDPPKSEAEWVYLNFTGRTTLTVDYPLDLVGTVVHYRFRWVNTRNQPGPWSETFSAIIP